MLFFTFVWKEDRGSLGKKLFPLFQAKVRWFRCRPPFPEWLDSISLVATPSLSPPLVRLPPFLNFLILLSLTILSRLQSPLQFLPPFSPHFSFQCFFSPPICCNRALCQQAGLSSWPSSAHPPCGSCQTSGLRTRVKSAVFPNAVFWGSFSERRREYLELLKRWAFAHCCNGYLVFMSCKAQRVREKRMQRFGPHSSKWFTAMTPEWKELSAISSKKKIMWII